MLQLTSTYKLSEQGKFYKETCHQSSVSSSSDKQSSPLFGSSASSTPIFDFDISYTLYFHCLPILVGMAVSFIVMSPIMAHFDLVLL
jgi:hypothetical protein